MIETDRPCLAHCGGRQASSPPLPASRTPSPGCAFPALACAQLARHAAKGASKDHDPWRPKWAAR
eukprot:10398792-Alexandrium_andersonii.AAC.1